MNNNRVEITAKDGVVNITGPGVGVLAAYGAISKAIIEGMSAHDLDAEFVRMALISMIKEINIEEDYKTQKKPIQ